MENILTRLRNDKKLLILIVFFLVHIPYFFLPIAGAHSWRQMDTAAVARNFFAESMNFFLPRIDIRGGLTGITGMGFPLYQYIISLVYYIVGDSYDVAGKILSFIYSLLVFLAAGKFYKAIWKKEPFYL